VIKRIFNVRLLLQELYYEKYIFKVNLNQQYHAGLHKQFIKFNGSLNI